MDKFTQHIGIAAPLLRDNVDTDAIIPSREMKSVSKNGLADGLFAAWRYLDDTSKLANPDFVLNQQPYSDASILLSGENFGCGSSREHAVWALKEFGIRAIIAESFGSIFYRNCIANGVLPITLGKTQIQALATAARIEIDLAQQTVATDDLSYQFEIQENKKTYLLEGLDAIALTLDLCGDDIQDFRLQDRKLRPWLY